MITTLKTMIRDEEGATMVEYGLLVALIALVAIVGVTLLGKNLNKLFNTVAGSLRTRSNQRDRGVAALTRSRLYPFLCTRKRK